MFLAYKIHSVNGNYYCYCKNGVSVGCSHPVLPHILKSAVAITCTSGKKIPRGLRRRWPPLQESLFEKGGQVLCWKGSGQVGLTLSRGRKLALSFSLLPSSYGNNEAERWETMREPGSGTCWRRCSITLPASRPHLAEYTP